MKAMLLFMRPIFFIFVLFLTISCAEKNKNSSAKYLYPTDSLQVEIGSPSLIKNSRQSTIHRQIFSRFL